MTIAPQANSGGDPHKTELQKDARAKAASTTNPAMYYDLSTYDPSSNTEGIARTTANYYVVRGYGNYKLPLVYGNALKEGSDNPDSYRAREGSGGSYRDDNGTSG